MGAGRTLTIDPSGRGKDETAFAVVKFLHGFLFLVALGGLRDGYTPETMETLARTAKAHGVNFIRVESNFGDGMFTELLKPHLQRIYPCAIEEERSVGQKELRIIDTLEPVMMQHRLIVDPRVIEEDYRQCEQDLKYSAFYQLTRITRDRGALAHDDRLEAIAGAVAYWVEQMARDGKVEAEKHREELLQRELEGFVHGIIGFPSVDDDMGGYTSEDLLPWMAALCYIRRSIKEDTFHGRYQYLAATHHRCVRWWVSLSNHPCLSVEALLWGS